MEKRDRLSIIIILFLFLPSIEMGIFPESITHGSSPGSGTFMEYTKIGSIGITFLLLFFPVTAIIIFLIRLTSCIKKHSNIKELLYDCICALIGIGIGIGILYLLPTNLILQFSALITSCIINYFDLMQLIL